MVAATTAEVETREGVAPEGVDPGADAPVGVMAEVVPAEVALEGRVAPEAIKAVVDAQVAARPEVCKALAAAAQAKLAVVVDTLFVP